MVQDEQAVTQRVAVLLGTRKYLRDDDKKLWIAYLEKNHNLRSVLGEEAFKAFSQIMETCPSYETVRRSRQKLQESGKYLGANRKKRIQEQRELVAFGKQTPEQIFNI